MVRAGRQLCDARNFSARSLEMETAGDYLRNGIKSRADALANLPSRARWFPQGDAAIRQRNGSRDSQPSSVKPMEGFLCRIQHRVSPMNERAPFVDPWSKEPNHQGVVPVDALFVGSWDNDVGIDDINEALFLVRDDRQDLLWSLTTYSEKLPGRTWRRESGDPAGQVRNKLRLCRWRAARGHAE